METATAAPKLATTGSTNPKPESDLKKQNFSTYVKFGILRKYIAFDGIPPTLENQDVGKLVRSVCRVIQHEQRVPNRGLALYGRRGTGKTGTMMEVAKTAVDLTVLKGKNQFDAWKISTSCQDFWSFCQNVRVGFGLHKPYVRELVENNDMIFLDDVGKVETDAGWIKDAFRELVDGVYNYGEGKILCFTSNHSRVQLCELYGEPCVDRIDEMCYAITFDGASLREKLIV